jgi:hypothetical protein
MIQAPKTTAVYQLDILNALAATGIRQLAPGGKARAFADAVADKLAELDRRSFSNLNDALLPYATGDSLDFLGEIFGIYRIPAQDVKIDADSGNFVFWVRNGTFGDINSGSDIVVPAGIRITTAATTGPVYVVAEETMLPATASRQSAAVTSLSPGVLGNTAAAVCTRHNFTGYTDSASGSLLVTNTYGVTGGREVEDDESFRYRISLKMKAKPAVNEAALRYELLQLPGVQDIYFEPKAGSFYVYLYSVAPVVSPQLIASAQQIIDQYAAYPILGTVLQPDLVGISLHTTITLIPGTLPAEKLIVADLARTAAEDYINNLRIGETLTINEIADRIRNADNRISDVGEPNNQLPEIFVWRSRLDGTRYSRFLISNLTPNPGERIVVETSISGAVSVTPL